MNDRNYDLTYCTVEEAQEDFVYSDDLNATIPAAFNCVVRLLMELDELEGELAELPDGRDDYDEEECDPDEEHRLDTVCLIEMRYEDIEQLISIFRAGVPATRAAEVALAAMLIALEHPDPQAPVPIGHAKTSAKDQVVRKWLSETADREADPALRSFRDDIAYLVDLPMARRHALTA